MPVGTWSAGRGSIDYLAQSIRLTFTSVGGATYGPGASFTFSNLAAKDAAGCVVKVASVNYITNKSVALSQVISQSSFTPTSVTMGFQNQGFYADWQPNEYIEVQLKFTPCLVSTPTYGTLPVSVANPACGPWKICFRVDVPNSAVANGTAQVNLQIYQSGTPVGPLLTPVAGPPATTTTNPLTQDGIICFEVPVSASYLNPTLGGFDYVATTNYTMPSATLTPTVIGSQPQGVAQGLNNDVKYDPTSCTGSTASTCCPPLDKPSLRGLFDHVGNSNLSYQMGVYLPVTVANRASFLAGYKAYLAYLKLICPTVAGLRVTFTLGTATGSGSPIAPIAGATSTFVVTGPFSPASVPPMFVNALNDNSWYGIYATTVAVNAQGQTVNCGFDAKSCDLNDRFTFNYLSGAKIAGGASPFTLGE